MSPLFRPQSLNRFAWTKTREHIPALLVATCSIPELLQRTRQGLRQLPLQLPLQFAQGILCHREEAIYLPSVVLVVEAGNVFRSSVLTIPISQLGPKSMAQYISARFAMP